MTTNCLRFVVGNIGHSYQFFFALFFQIYSSVFSKQANHLTGKINATHKHNIHKK